MSGAAVRLSPGHLAEIEAQALEKLNRSQKCRQLRGYLN